MLSDGAAFNTQSFRSQQYRVHSLSFKQNPFYSCFCKSMKMYHTAPGVHIQQRLFCPPLLYRIPSARYVVITSLLEQAPDWLTRREYPPKFRFFNSRDSRGKCPKRSIRAASFAQTAPQDVYSRLWIDLTCKSLALNASFTSGVNAPLSSVS